MAGYKIRDEMNGIEEAPGKLWFWELEEAVIDADRCVQCGACIAACPSDSIGIGADGLPKLVKMCTGCSLCWDFCPRGGLRHEATWSLPVAGSDGVGWKITGAAASGQGLGPVSETYSARVRPQLPGAQDGGVVSALLIALLEAGDIDGALVARESATEPWKGEPFLARTPEQVIECAGGFGQFVFAHELPDIDWVPADGLGVTLDIAPQVLDERGLLDLVERLADLGWATADARWSIQQSKRNWHGLGSAAFATQLPRWQPRANSPEAHHSEEICYVDRCDGGFYTLTANLAAHRFRRTTMVSLSFQLEGTPLDPAPLLQLCRSVGVHDALYFRARTEKSVSRFQPDDQRSLTVRPLGYVTTPERDPAFPFTQWATGIIIANPYRRSADSGGVGLVPECLQMLQDSEYLICDLAEHHPLDGRNCEYHVRAFEIARTSDALVCRPVANWASVDADRGESGNVNHEW